MGRWTHLDTDGERLPDGMTRVGYDAHTQVYTYRDTDGSHWEGAPGAQYGKLFRVHSHAPQLPSITIPDDVDGDEQPQVLHDYDDDDDDKQPPSNTHDPEKSPTSTITEPRRAKVRRSHYQQHASKQLPSLPDEKNPSTTSTDEKNPFRDPKDSDSNSSLIQKEKDQTQNPTFGTTTNRHRQRRAQEREEKKQEQHALKRSGTLSRIARYLSRNAGGGSERTEHEGIVRRGTVGSRKKRQWPAVPGGTFVGGGGGSRDDEGEEGYEKEEVEGLEYQRGGHRRDFSGSFKTRGRAMTFDEILGGDGRLVKRGS